MKKKLIIAIVASLFVAFYLTSCGGADVHEEEYDPDIFAHLREGEHVLVVDMRVFPFRQLNLPDTLATTVQRFESRMAEEGIDVTVRLRGPRAQRLQFESLDDMRARRNVEFMTGRGADLVIFEGESLFSFSRSGLLADIWELIDRDPSVSREDFHENVLRAFEVDGRLVAMPFRFTVPYIAINNRLPYSLVSRFNEMETITLSDMMRLYNELVYSYPQYGHLWLANGLEIELAILYELASHFDLPNGAVNFDAARFADFLELAKPWLLRAKPELLLTTQNHDGQTQQIWMYWSTVQFMDTFGPRWLHTEEQLRRYSEATVFLKMQSSLQQAVALLPLNADYFVGIGPLVLECGRHIIYCGLHFGGNRQSNSYFIANGSNSVLAWEFLKDLIVFHDSIIASIFTHDGRNTLAMPIIRGLNEWRTEEVLTSLFRTYNTFFGHHTSPFKRVDSADRIEGYVQAAMDRLNHIAEQPMVAVPFIPVDFFMDEVMLFLNGVILAQEAANRIGNRLTLWMMEH